MQHPSDATEAIQLNGPIDTDADVLAKPDAPFFVPTKEDKEALYPSFFDGAVPTDIKQKCDKGELYVWKTLPTADSNIGRLNNSYLSSKNWTYAME